MCLVGSCRWRNCAIWDIMFQNGVVLMKGVWVIHDNVIKWKHFPHYWYVARGIHRSPVNSPHKGQWRGALITSFFFDLRLKKRWSKAMERPVIWDAIAFIIISNKRIVIFVRERDVVRSYHDACKQKRQMECFINIHIPDLVKWFDSDPIKNCGFHEAGINTSQPFNP